MQVVNGQYIDRINGCECYISTDNNVCLNEFGNKVRSITNLTFCATGMDNIPHLCPVKVYEQETDYLDRYGMD